MVRLLTGDLSERENVRALNDGERRPPKYKVSGYPTRPIRPDLPCPLLEALYLAEEYGHMAEDQIRRGSDRFAYHYARQAAGFGQEVLVAPRA